MPKLRSEGDGTELCVNRGWAVARRMTACSQRAEACQQQKSLPRRTARMASPRKAGYLHSFWPILPFPSPPGPSLQVLPELSPGSRKRDLRLVDSRL